MIASAPWNGETLNTQPKKQFSVRNLNQQTYAIDVHNHIILLNAFSKLKQKYSAFIPRIEAEPNGMYTLTIRGHKVLSRRKGRYDLEERIKDMDRMHVCIHTLTVGPNTLYYDLDSQAGLELSKAQNEAMAEVVEKHPDRFVGLGVVPLQDPVLAAEEAERAVKTLGLKGFAVGPSINGKNLDDSSLEPFYAKAEKLNAMISVHPDADVAHPLVGLVGERLEKYSLGNLIGNPLDTTIAIASVVFGGVLKRHPRLKFLFLHGGGFAPYQRGRWEHGFKVREVTRVNISEPPSKYISLLTFDTITHYEPALRYLISTMGSDKVALGSDYAADMSDTDPVRSVKNLNLSQEDEKKILRGNAERLLNL